MRLKLNAVRGSQVSINVFYSVVSNSTAQINVGHEYFTSEIRDVVCCQIIFLGNWLHRNKFIFLATLRSAPLEGGMLTAVARPSPALIQDTFGCPLVIKHIPKCAYCLIDIVTPLNVAFVFAIKHFIEAMTAYFHF